MTEQYRFWSKVRIGWPDECWLWQASTNGKQGYGRFHLDGGRDVTAHRYALLAAHGRLDDSRCVLHSCDVRTCCNPRHLRLGTNAENTLDREKRGRNPDAKLTAGAVREIRRLLAGGVTQTEIAAAHDISQPQVSAIKTGNAWGWVK